VRVRSLARTRLRACACTQDYLDLERTCAMNRSSRPSTGPCGRRCCRTPRRPSTPAPRLESRSCGARRSGGFRANGRVCMLMWRPAPARYPRSGHCHTRRAMRVTCGAPRRRAPARARSQRTRRRPSVGSQRDTQHRTRQRGVCALARSQQPLQHNAPSRERRARRLRDASNARAHQPRAHFSLARARRPPAARGPPPGARPPFPAPCSLRR